MLFTAERDGHAQEIGNNQRLRHCGRFSENSAERKEGKSTTLSSRYKVIQCDFNCETPCYMFPLFSTSSITIWAKGCEHSGCYIEEGSSTFLRNCGVCLQSHVSERRGTRTYNHKNLTSLKCACTLCLPACRAALNAGFEALSVAVMNRSVSWVMRRDAV
jgi:hypothetical protein